MRKKLETILENTKSKGVKIISIVATSYFLGLTTSVIGNKIGGDWEYILPITPLLLGFNININWATPFYILGIATNYSRQIYQITKDIC
jgi:hypothetical protein